MAYYHLFCFSVILLFGFGSTAEEPTLKFPEGFLIGTGSSAYQNEGAWNVSDKGENFWDHRTHTLPHKFKDGLDGDVACDSYKKYTEDVQLVKQMNMSFYRFSLSWTRILPTGYPNKVSKDGIDYYNRLINELINNHITPIVTIYHWDHPQLFQEMGGWTNEAMVDWFGDYARIVFQNFGDKVKIFSTINEPPTLCSRIYAINLGLGKQAQYLCTVNIIKAHARAYHIYKEEFKSQNGQLGIVINADHYFPKNEGDTQSEDIAYQFNFDIYAHPIYSTEGDFPAIVKARIEENCKFEGLQRSRLPTLTDDWIDYIKGSYDYLGINHYTSSVVEPASKPNNTVYVNDDGLAYSHNSSWPTTPTDWLKFVPEGFLHVLKRIKTTYGNVPVFVMENGVADDGTLNDIQRMEYLYSYMKNMLIAINDHGVNVKGYGVWTLMDNFQWHSGYTVKFGLFSVNFTDLNRPRTAKKSVAWLTNVVSSRQLVPWTEYL